MSGMQHECEVRKQIKAHLQRCMTLPQYYNYPHADLIADYTRQIEKIDEFLSIWDTQSTDESQ